MQNFEALLPDDDYNRNLRSNVHPIDYKNPIPKDRYHLIVIGAGTAGLVTAAGAAGMGAKVALVERSLMGGDCLNVGCVPSKGIISAARAAAGVRRSAEFGVNVPNEVTVDFFAAMERMRKLRSEISHHDSVTRFRDLGIDVFLGQGRFSSNTTVDVEGTTLNFRKAVIATGARASAPALQGLKSVDYLTNETLYSLTELPRRFGVIGAGPIGCEMAQTFAQLGSEVFLFESEEGILAREDHDASQIIRKALIKDGVNILSGGKDLRIAAADRGGIQLSVDSPNNKHDFTVDKLLVAVGRAPNVDGLGLDSVGVKYDSKGVLVDDCYRTTNSKIYAAGDICSPFKFTHAADFIARTVIRNALFLGRAKGSKLVIPWCTYTSPELSHVGLTPSELKEKGIEFDTFTQKFSDIDRAILEGETEGFVKVHVHKGSDKIVGATVVAPNAGDLIGMLTLAITKNIGLGSIASVILPYPTQGEAIRKVGDLYNQTRLTPLVKGLLNKWLSWTS